MISKAKRMSGAKVSGSWSESSWNFRFRVRKFLGTRVPGSESSREQKWNFRSQTVDPGFMTSLQWASLVAYRLMYLLITCRQPLIPMCRSRGQWLATVIIKSSLTSITPDNSRYSRPVQCWDTESSTWASSWQKYITHQHTVTKLDTSAEKQFSSELNVKGNFKLNSQDSWQLCMIWYDEEILKGA